MLRYSLIIALPVLLLFSTCKQDNNKPIVVPPITSPKAVVPKFNKDSAYSFVAKQVDFGPRVPNSIEHTACANWIAQKMENFGGSVIKQNFNTTRFDGEKLSATNIIGVFNPEQKERILLCAHWDTRYVGDQDEREGMKNKPILGADDAGSGVGILLEIARQIQANKVDIGIDIVFFDVEDQGESGETYNPTSWCLGSQHWARKPHKAAYSAKFGILLDMAGSKGARFVKEGTSMKYAPKVMNDVWDVAHSIGYSDFFDMQKTRNETTDDHLFINQILHIPTIDIINRPVKTMTGFGSYWHTHNDNMDVISKRTLKAVGQTVLTVVYRAATKEL